MSKKLDLTPEAVAGFEGKKCSHLWTSPRWYAHKLGEYLRSSGRPLPRDVRMSRGSQIHASDMLFKGIHKEKGQIEFERLK